MHVSRTLCLCVCVYVNVNVRVRICACIRICALESRKRNLGNVFCSRVSEVVTAQVQALERRALYINTHTHTRSCITHSHIHKRTRRTHTLHQTMGGHV